MVALVVCLAFALLTALLALRADQRQARDEGQHRHRTTATTVAAAVPDEPGALTGAGRYHAQAVWQFPAAVRGSGPVEVGSDSGVGTAVAIWVDDQGRPASPTRPGTEIATTAVVIGAGAMAGLSGAALAGYALGRRRIDRKTTAAWETEWEGVEPEWSGHPRRRPEAGDQ
ncbi:hypothetical protein OG535_05650 [Kitasatospora sp. NBC_00085]|uniref:Rv1733c family protein n=1 Tax=unclassified Kitasatospora TaxID=2633591 RepID=UPI00324A50E5